MHVTNSNWAFICQKWSSLLHVDLTGNIEAKLEFSMAVIGLGLSNIKQTCKKYEVLNDKYASQLEKVRQSLKRIAGSLGDEPWIKAKKYHDAYEDCPNFESRFPKPPLNDQLEAIGIMLLDSFSIVDVIKLEGKTYYQPLTIMMLGGSVAAVYAECRQIFQNL